MHIQKEGVLFYRNLFADVPTKTRSYIYIHTLGFNALVWPREMSGPRSCGYDMIGGRVLDAREQLYLPRNFRGILSWEVISRI